jgi:hypothetical protein
MAQSQGGQAVTDEEINEAIADHVGWKWYAVEKGGWFYRKGGHGYTYRIEEAGKYTKEDAEKQLCYGEPMSVVKIPVPSYTTDLNAMREALNTLTDDESWRLILHLSDITRNEHHSDPDDWFNRSTDWTWRVVNATAHQRSEAFLRTLGKWKEAKP